MKFDKDKVRRSLQGKSSGVTCSGKNGGKVVIVGEGEERTLEEMDAESARDLERATGHSMSWLLQHGWNESSDPDEFMHE